jgi:hypothetical protein
MHHQSIIKKINVCKYYHRDYVLQSSGELGFLFEPYYNLIVPEKLLGTLHNAKLPLFSSIVISGVLEEKDPCNGSNSFHGLNSFIGHNNSNRCCCSILNLILMMPLETTN